MKRLENLKFLLESDNNSFYNAIEMQKRCGKLTINSIQIPITPSLIPEKYDVYFVVIVQDAKNFETLEITSNSASARENMNKSDFMVNFQRGIDITRPLRDDFELDVIVYEYACQMEFEDRKEAKKTVLDRARKALGKDRKGKESLKESIKLNEKKAKSYEESRFKESSWEG